MDYTPGDGSEYRPIEILTVEAVFALTEQEGISDSVPLAFTIEGIGDIYRVEDIVRCWPGEPISRGEFDRRLVRMRWFKNLMGMDTGLLYLILHPEPHEALTSSPNERLTGPNGTAESLEGGCSGLVSHEVHDKEAEQ